MDWLPDEITTEIFSRLPVKSLLRARSLCKGVRDFTHNPDFVDKHLKFSSQRNPNLILNCYESSRCTEGNNLYERVYSLYFVQTEETPNDYSCNKVRLEIPDFKEFSIMGSCNGLICLVHPTKRYKIYVCNPCTGKYIQIPPPVSREDGPLDIVVGFGVIPETNKYKVVAIVDSLGDFNRLLQMVYVFTLGGTTWKRLKDNSPVLRLGQSACKACVNGALHWVSDARLIVSFNMDTEEFVVIPRPELELGRGSFNLRVFEGKLMILNTSFGDRIEIWVMKDYGVVESWTRTFTVYEQHIGRNIQGVSIECFLENGDVLMVYDCGALLRYNLQSASVSELIIDGLPERLYAFAHVGTLVSPLPRIDEQIELDESNTNTTSVNWNLANDRHLRQLRSGFPTPDEQNLSAPDPRSRGEEDSEHLQLQVHQYSGATIGISEYGSTSDTAPERGVLSMEELIRLNEMGEVVTQGQKLSPEDKESLTRETDEVSHSSEELLEEIRLEELEETPSDPRELEKLNCDPMEVPPTISHHFSILRVLDLSYTEINSLPQCISILVPLQKLFLRSCELLMELPPEIGELTNLEVLDLEGTEIMCLPKEIAKLVNLTCLKVSFYGYANQTVIPRKVLPHLSRLKELIIDVTPYGEWWDVEVEAIIADLRNLKELRTLKLYLPTAKILKDLLSIFPSLANFRFTVGRHEEHFISRLPQDVEKEFNNQEKLEKGLKYINGSHIPNEITEVFKHANAFFLQCHWTAKSLSEFGHENMKEVKFCLVMECNEFRTIIDSERYYQGKDGRSESKDFMDIDETIVLGSLKKMIIRYMKNMASIWKGPVGKGSLSYLKYLALHTCPNLTTLFTIDMLSNLINLEELIVEDCPKIDSLVSLKSSNSKSGLFLPNLKKISLLELPELVSISNGLRIAPKLERMFTFYCPKLEKLSSMDVSSTNLKVIKGEKEWWDALKWYESDLSTKHEDYLARLFIPLRRDGDLMAQLTKD